MQSPISLVKGPEDSNKEGSSQREGSTMACQGEAHTVDGAKRSGRYKW